MYKLTKEEEIISKSISYYLRHKPEELKIELDLNGWTSLNIFLENLGLELKENITLEKAEYIINASQKKRVEINLDKGLIRAKYGHSTNINPNYPLLTEPVKLYHGTAASNYLSIGQEGIVSKSRVYVHLTSDKSLAKLTAKRWSKEISILQIDTNKMLADQVPIFVAGEEVYLTEFVSPKYILI